MKCAEVMEWMHRYLDHDLSQNEMIEMFRHIDDCPSCAEVFDRLTMLSEQLEQLPDVKPPFSLVDSIMPQLDKLELNIKDLNVKEPIAESLEESNVIPMKRKNTQDKTSKGASMAARTGIGAVAAAVILLIAVLYMPDSMPTADVDNALQKSYDSKEANQSVSQMTADNAAGGDQNAAPEEARLDSDLQPSQSADTSAANGTDDTADRAVTGEQEATPAAANTAQASEAPPVSRKSAAPTKQPAASQRSDKPASASVSGGAEQGGDMAGQRATGDEDRDVASGSRELHDEGLDPADGEMGLMSQLPYLEAIQSSWTSPDGKYTAELAGHQLVIYKLATAELQHERTALSLIPLEGEWVSGSWSADLQFSYITKQDGKEISKVYAVPESLPSDAPTASPKSAPTASAPVSTDAATSNN